MRIASLLLLLCSFTYSQTPNSLTPQEAADGWVLLFDGQTLFGWTKDGPTEWRVVDGSIVAEGGETGWLRTNAVFGDYLLRCEFRSGGASGIFLPAGKDPGYQLPARTAGKNAPAERWQSYEVDVRGGQFVVKLNGQRLAGGKELAGRTGSIGLLHESDNKVEYRNVKVKPLGLKPLFNEKTLSGWRKVDTPRAKEPPVWSVQKGAIHVEKGPGQLETESMYQDFILQLAIRTNANGPDHHPNSGVFFRGDPNGFWTGYEAQIRNEYKDKDRTQPVDFGTGAIYHYSPARKVVSNDNEWFTMTVSAHGRRLMVWVDGYPVTDWQDPHPEGTNVRNKEAKLTPGVISLQAHDPTTNLDFRNLRILTFQE